MKENFSFDAWAHLPDKTRSEKVHVVVKGAAVGIHTMGGRLIAAGIWDAGKYVRYPRSQDVPLPPQLLDEIDLELRRQMTTKGVQLRVDPPRRSALGYSNR